MLVFSSREEVWNILWAYFKERLTTENHKLVAILRVSVGGLSGQNDLLLSFPTGILSLPLARFFYFFTRCFLHCVLSNWMPGRGYSVCTTVIFHFKQCLYFFCVYIASSLGLNMWGVVKILESYTSPQVHLRPVCITVLNSLNPLCVWVRLHVCKHRTSILLLNKYRHIYHDWNCYFFNISFLT